MKTKVDAKCQNGQCRRNEAGAEQEKYEAKSVVVVVTGKYPETKQKATNGTAKKRE